MRHANVLEHHVVPAGRTIGVTVEGTQVGVQPVSAGTGVAGFATSPGDDGQVGRRGTEPQLLLVSTGGNSHQTTDLVGGEHQVVLDLLLGQTEVDQVLVAHVGSAVAVQA